MRLYFTPIFRDILTSSVWAHDAEVRIVWITLLLSADPEGYVPGAPPGIALAANVPLEAVRRALALFEAPDPDSRSLGHEGRRLEKVDRGWRILNFEAHSQRAKLEGEKARKRKWAKLNRKPANDTVPPLHVDAEPLHASTSSATVDAPKPKPKTKPISPDGEISPLPPEVELAKAEMPLTERYVSPLLEAGVLPATYRTLDGWVLSDELRAEAVMAGVPDIDERIAQLRTGPIGGTRGVIDRDGYVRSQFSRWRRWRETDEAKARQATQLPPGSTFRGRYGGAQGGGDESSSWGGATVAHRALCQKHELDVNELEPEFRQTGAHKVGTEKEINLAFAKFIASKAKAKRGAA